MKKLLVTLTALAIGMSSLFAWTNTITLGASGSVPTYVTPVDSDMDSCSLNSTGINIGYIGYFDFGLAFFDSTSVGMGSAKSAALEGFSSTSVGPLNVSATEIIGVGYGIIRTDNLFLGIFGTAGFSTDIAFVAKKNKEIIDAKAFILEGGLIGANLTAVYTPAKVFSLYASVTANVGLGTIQTASDSVNINSKNENEKRHHDDVITGVTAAYPYLKVIPSVGIAWRF